MISAWPIVGSSQDQLHLKKVKLAMALLGTNKHYRITEINRRHFNMTAQRCGLGSDMEGIIAEVVTNTPSVIADVSAELPKHFPARVFDAIATGLQRAARQLEAMPSE